MNDAGESGDYFDGLRIKLVAGNSNKPLAEGISSV